jgi:hypothetical protein
MTVEETIDQLVKLPMDAQVWLSVKGELEPLCIVDIASGYDPRYGSFPRNGEDVVLEDF